MEYKESDIPIEIRHGEMLYFDDGGSIRWESNGEAKDVFLGDGFSCDVELFPSSTWEFEHAGKTFRLTASFDDALLIEKI